MSDVKLRKLDRSAWEPQNLARLIHEGVSSGCYPESPRGEIPDAFATQDGWGYTCEPGEGQLSLVGPKEGRGRRLIDMDWCEAFHYVRPIARTGDGRNGQIARRAGAGPHDPQVPGWTMGDVRFVFAAEEGERDRDPWIALMQLWDGRYAFLEVGCDYTGWDCQAYGQGTVHDDLFTLISMGIGEEARRRLFS